MLYNVKVLQLSFLLLNYFESFKLLKLRTLKVLRPTNPEMPTK